MIRRRLAELLPETDDAAHARLHARLAADAERDGVLDIGYHTIDSPVGALLLAATTRGLVRIAFAREDHDAALEELAQRLSPRVLRAPRRLDMAGRQLAEYFTGDRAAFDLPLDLSLVRGFRRTVLTRLTEVEYGRTSSYAQLAAAAGNPRAARAAGSACATNPLPVVVPCHRAIRSDGSIGEYLGGPEAKRTLLRLEKTGPL